MPSLSSPPLHDPTLLARLRNPRKYPTSDGRTKQEAQLSQRDRAMLHVIEDLAKSLKITQSHSK